MSVNPCYRLLHFVDLLKASHRHIKILYCFLSNSTGTLEGRLPAAQAVHYSGHLRQFVPGQSCECRGCDKEHAQPLCYL